MVHALKLRIRNLHSVVLGPTVQAPKKEVKKDAWLCKSFAVLLKRKKRMGLRSSNRDFQYLLNLLDGIDAEAQGLNMLRAGALK